MITKKILFGLIKVEKSEFKKKVYFLGMKIYSKTNILARFYQQQYEILFSSWFRHGVTDELLSHLKLLALSPCAMQKMPSDTWLVYLCCLISRNMVDEAKKILKRYIYLYGYKNIQNYFLVADFAVKNGVKDDRIEKTAYVWQKLNDKPRQERFKEYLRTRSIAVVGGSGCELGKNKGEEIDSHGAVVRFGNYPTDEKYYCDYGKKTNVWVRTISVDVIHKPYISEYDWVIWRAYLDHVFIRDEHVDNMYEYLSVDNPKLVMLEPELCETLDTEYDIYRPTAGCTTLYYLYKLFGGTDNIDVYGFSFLAKDYNDTKHYFDNVCKVSVNHDMKFEIDLLSDIYN